MPLSPLSPIPKRTTQGTPLTSQQHDDIHEQLLGGINAVIAVVNTLTGTGGGGGIPTGTIVPYGGATLPTGYVWANGQVLSTITYPELYAVYGTTYNTGGESPTQFRVPNIIGKSISGTNPMGGVTDGTYTSRALGAIFGAESVSYTPQGSVSQASIASLTASSSAIDLASLTVTSGAIDISSVTGSVSTATATSSGIDISGVTATCGSIDTGSLTASVGLNNGAIAGVGTAAVSGGLCVDVPTTEPTGTSAIDCGSALTVDIATIAAGLTTNVSVSSATIGGSIPPPTITIGGAIPAPTITVNPQTVTIGGSIPPPTMTVGGSIPAPSITIGGSIAAQTFSGTLATIATLPPRIAMNWIVKH